MPWILRPHSLGIVAPALAATPVSLSVGHLYCSSMLAEQPDADNNGLYLGTKDLVVATPIGLIHDFAGGAFELDLTPDPRMLYDLQDYYIDSTVNLKGAWITYWSWEKVT